MANNSYSHRRRVFKIPYHKKLLKFWGSSILAYLWCNERTGTTLNDLKGNNRTATLAGTSPPVIAGANGMGDGELAVSFGGGTDCYASFNTLSLRNALNNQEGAFLAWINGITTTIWDDGTLDYIFNAYTDASNYLRAYKRGSTIRELVIQYLAGGTNVFRIVNARNPNAFRFGFTWSKSNNRIRLYVNGNQLGADATGLGTWAGSWSSSYPILGAEATSSANSLNGNLSHVMFLDREPTAAEMANEYLLWATPKKIVGIGDSIMAYSTITSFSWMVRDQYNGGNNWFYNHAVSGHSIMANMDGQVTAAASENADIIILQLGTNDDNAGDMVALQAEVEENLDELMSNHPRATIYYMNILPRWTDTSGVTEVLKNNTRAAIAAACSAKSVTCWDTYTTPWITASQTLDGLHPNNDGHAAIVAEILTRL